MVVVEEGPCAFGVTFQCVGPVTDFLPSVPLPGPYPLNPPAMDELPECWYVVNHGTEVGIFADK